MGVRGSIKPGAGDLGSPESRSGRESSLGGLGRENAGGMTPLPGILPSGLLSLFIVTRRGVLSTPPSPVIIPGDLGSTSNNLTGVSQDLSIAIGVLSNPSDADRGSPLSILVLSLPANVFCIIFTSFSLSFSNVHRHPAACPRWLPLLCHTEYYPWLVLGNRMILFQFISCR